MIETKDMGLPVKSSAIAPPNIPNGIMDNTIIIPLKFLNCNKEHAYKKEATYMTEKKLPPRTSPSDSTSPDNL